MGAEVTVVEGINVNLPKQIWQLSSHFKLLAECTKAVHDWHFDKQKWATCEKMFHFVSVHKRIVGFLAVSYTSRSKCLNEIPRVF